MHNTQFHPICCIPKWILHTQTPRWTAVTIPHPQRGKSVAFLKVRSASASGHPFPVVPNSVVRLDSSLFLCVCIIAISEPHWLFLQNNTQNPLVYYLPTACCSLDQPPIVQGDSMLWDCCSFLCLSATFSHSNSHMDGPRPKNTLIGTHPSSDPPPQQRLISRRVKVR